MESGSLYDLLRNETMYFSGEMILQITRDVSIMRVHYFIFAILKSDLMFLFALAYQLAQGLRYLHSSKPPILHGDLKAKNLLIDSRFRCKLCDFGLSNKGTGKISGTPYWLAPEYLRGEKDYDTTCGTFKSWKLEVGTLSHISN